MSKRHQSSRRRTYGRRQHELHERHDRRSRDAWSTDEHVPVEPTGLGFATATRSGLGLADWSDWSLD